MDIDFSLLLVVGTFVTGVIWLYDQVLLAPKRRLLAEGVQAQLSAQGVDEDHAKGLQQAVSKKLPEPVLVEYSKSFFPILFVVLVIRSFLVEPFQIPSGSMRPTLEVGDFILVNKFHYGLRLPVVGTKVVSLNDPARGDIMVFKFPEDPRINYIKRVVGLPGDRIRYDNKTLIINGKVVSPSLLAQLPPQAPKMELLAEQLGTVEHHIYRDLTRPRPAAEWVVPAGHYFMMGDNRDNSNDSRFWGFVPEELIVGKAFAIWLHWESWGSWPSFRNNGFVE
jgi:signal peptidase I